MLWGFNQRLPYVIEEPGPAFNVLGEDNGVEVIQVEGAQTSENPGSLDLLTVHVIGSPRNTPTFFELVPPFFSNDRSIVPLEMYFPVGLTREQALEAERKDFDASQMAAVAAAKTALSPEIAKTLAVKLNLKNVVGPSGGLMFTLGIIEKATSESLTGGKKIAGTGTISNDGQVGPIGGIRFKMLSAKRAGDQFFLAPKQNCDEVFGNTPSGLKVFAVKNLKQALDALKVIAADGDVSKLPVCSAK